MELLPGNWMNNDIKIETLSLRSIAHLGDAVYELYIRRKLIFIANDTENMHNLTTSLVNSLFHVELLTFLSPNLTENELDIVRRGRNITLSKSKRKDQTVHRISTSLETLIGYLYLTNIARLEEIFILISSYIDEKLNL